MFGMRWFWKMIGFRPVFFIEGDSGGGSGAGSGAAGAGGAGGNSAAAGPPAGGVAAAGGAGAGEGGEAERLTAEAKRAFAERDSAIKESRRLQLSIADYERKESERSALEAKAKEEADARGLEERKQYDAALQLRDKKHTEELERERERGKQSAVRRVQADLRAAVASIDGVVGESAPEVAELLMGHVGLDDNYEPFVKGPDGKQRRNVEDPTKPVTIAELAAEFLKARPWYLKSRTPPGSGAASGQSGDAAGGGWDINKAKADVAYDQEWQAKDKAGHDAAWARVFAEASAPKKK